ncbi:MAG TPA: lysine--tRNA ligase [Kouleothrix sp.]|uniref:lysine--tRNA ligase n=1 Tax=Kouleothrix sp. TaxID=2779161 RepID=UPI002C6CCCFB|nr:lysine--tRNA ligase [Kouleothrix sp.]HRC75859.1 lysine--tRNA ligase [Kouleothrix sp.]
MELNELQQQRLAKLERLRAAGIDPFPPRSHRTHPIADVLADFDAIAARAERVTLAGRIMGARRIMGKLAFAHIADESGTIQLWISKADLGDEWFARFRDDIDTFDIVEVSGLLRRTKSGEASIFVERMAVLAKALNPPPEKWHGLTDVEARLRERYLDLIVNDEVRAIFRTRAKIITAMRRFLDNRGFLEVETPALQPVYGGASARPFVTHHNQLKQQLYLRIADELYLKRLIVGQLGRVYEISKDFRNEGVDRTHNTEFTMMECYQAFADYNDIMRLVEEMFRAIALETCGTTTVTYQGHTIDFGPDWQRVSIPEAIVEKTGIDIMQLTELVPLQQAIRAAGLKVENKPSWGKQVDELFSEYVQPLLIQPTFILDHPVPLSPLAKKRPDQPALTERFEPIIAGMEMGNAFSELNDPLDQEQRFLEQGRAYDAGDDEAQQMDTDYLNALMYGMPPTGGLGIGVDRVVMLFTDQSTIREVVLFPHLRQTE